MASKPVKTTNEVFVDSVRDLLEGTPNASHPVQFERVLADPYFVVCTLCGAAVPFSGKWQDLHRQNHDEHNRVHDGIEVQARRYIPAPRYG